MDDYHVIISSWLNSSLVFLIGHIPEQMHIGISARADPPFSLSRLLARNQLIELRASDLFFTLTKTSSFSQ
jgi:LuxR family transcriptional regulator, maltose regulon positive regulatory protein